MTTTTTSVTDSQSQTAHSMCMHVFAPAFFSKILCFMSWVAAVLAFDGARSYYLYVRVAIMEPGMASLAWLSRP